MAAAECRSCGAVMDEAWSVCPECGAPPGMDPAAADTPGFARAPASRATDAAGHGRPRRRRPRRAAGEPGPQFARLVQRKQTRSLESWVVLVVVCLLPLGVVAVWVTYLVSLARDGATGAFTALFCLPLLLVVFVTWRLLVGAGAPLLPFGRRDQPKQQRSLGWWVVFVALGLGFLGVLAVWVAYLVTFARDGASAASA